MTTDSSWERLRLKDRLAAGLRVLFVGINPGVRSAQTGHHFAGFSNRFWRLLFEAGLVPEQIGYQDDVRLPQWGFGLTNLIARPSPGIDTLRPQEYARARAGLLRKVRRYQPAVVALVGVTLYRALFLERGRHVVVLGLQPETLAGAEVFVLPNPSGRNASFRYEERLAAFKDLSEHLRESNRREGRGAGRRRG